MARPSLGLGLLDMRAKLDISLKKTFARFCDKRTDAHRGTDRHEDLDKRWPGHQKLYKIWEDRHLSLKYLKNDFLKQRLNQYFLFNSQLRSTNKTTVNGLITWWAFIALKIYYYYFRGLSSGHCRYIRGRQNTLSARPGGPRADNDIVSPPRRAAGRQ